MGSCRAEAACEGSRSYKEMVRSLGGIQNADHLQLDSPRGGGSARLAGARGGRSSRGRHLRQAAFLPAAAGPAPPPSTSALRLFCWGPRGNPRRTRGASRRGAHSSVGVRRPRPPSAAPRQPAPQLSPARQRGRPACAPGLRPPPRHAAGPSRWPRTLSSGSGPGGAHRAGARRATAPRGQIRGEGAGAPVGGWGGRAGRRTRAEGGRRGGEGGTGSPGAGGGIRASGVSGRAGPTRAARARAAGAGETPARRGPGPGALTHPRSPPGARRSG